MRTKSRVGGIPQSPYLRCVRRWGIFLPLALFAALLLSAPLPGQEEGADEVVAEPAPVQEMAFNDQQFDQWVFQHLQTADAARKSLNAQLTLQTEELDRVCELTDAQRKKLQLAGRGDIKRFFDRYEEVKRKAHALKRDQQRFQEIWQDIGPLQVTLQAGLFHPESLFKKSLRNTLTGGQWSNYEAIARDHRAFRHRAKIEMVVAVLEQAVPLTGEQRQRLVTLLIDETKPPRKTGQYDYYVILFQMSRLPEEKLKPVFDDLQWKILERQLGQFKNNLEPWLKQSGFLPEDEDEEADAPPAERQE